MNYNTTSLNTPSKRSNVEDHILLPQSGSNFALSSLNLRRELFVTPVANKITTPQSPPPLCNDRKRVRRQSPFQDQQDCAKFLLPKFDEDDNNGDAVNVKTPLRHRLIQRLSHPVTFKEENGRELFMTPIANKIAPVTSPPIFSRDRKRSRQCVFQGQELCSEFLLPKFDEDNNDTYKSNARKSAYKFQLVQRLSHPFPLKQGEKKNLLMIHKANEERRPVSQSDKMNGVNSNNLSVVTLPRPNGLRKQFSVTALTA